MSILSESMTIPSGSRTIKRMRASLDIVPQEASTGTGQPDVGRRTLVCFSHLRWGFVWQRPQHLLTRAAAEFDVVVVEEPVATAGPARLDLSHPQPNVTVAVPHLPEGLDAEEAAAAQKALIEAFLEPVDPKDRIFWYYTPASLVFSQDLPRGLTVFDNMDDLASFKGASPALVAQETQLLRQSDVVFTGGLSLFEAKAGRHPNIHAFPSSIDAPHFAAARGHDKGRRGARAHPPRLGFFGVIDERLDIDLLDAVATVRPDWRIDMIGPVVKIDPATLPRQTNIAWRGQAAYADLPAILAEWDVGIMPFAINAATRFISPTKTPEFLAAGLPVVSTPILDVVRSYGQHGLVEVASTPDGFVAAVETVLNSPAEGWLDRVDLHLARSSWDSTWAGMRALMRQASSKRRTDTTVEAIQATGPLAVQAAE